MAGTQWSGCGIGDRKYGHLLRRFVLVCRERCLRQLAVRLFLRRFRLLLRRQFVVLRQFLFLR
ncbi:hypothetical protein [Streptomyces djakartensis]|uniref:hypothetical protein n=1 Tax=Streptomyces djakartensis TaxID=68193 RepID=UPI00167E044D|nr:hypothetical protein [Streptomyces djakartensis]